MQTIVITLNPGKLTNLDLRYQIPDRIEEVTQGKTKDNGYDYLYTEGQRAPLLGLWLEAEAAADQYGEIVKLFQKKTFLENNLSVSAEIYIAEEETAELKVCRKVHHFL